MDIVKTKKKIAKKTIRLNTVLMIAFLLFTPAFAFNSNTGALDQFVTFICEWVTKIGMVVALLGGVMFAIGWSNDQQEMKSRGLMVIAGGFMLVGIGNAPGIFGL